MLHVHRAERTSELARGLADLLSTPPADPFVPDVVAVPTKGVERWLAQRLSHALGADTAETGDGVCANVTFPSPNRLLAEAFAAGSAVDPGDDPWTVGRTTWTLLTVIDNSLTEPWCAPLAGYLGTATEHAPGRRLTTAQRLARLFASYAVARPRMLCEWAAGDDTDGAGGALRDDLTWQAQLWRRLRTTIGADSPAERLPTACQALHDSPDLVDLPDRVSLFGPTRLSTAQLDILTALAAHRGVHLWLPHPSPALWATLERYEASSPRRHLDTTSDRTRNTLLASLGRDVRELQLRLGVRTSDHIATAATNNDGTLLARLQHAIRDDSAEPLTPPTPSDKSLQVHACHGPARQVEVLREVLVGLLADDPTLEPRDVLVMCPNIEDYAPLISATFGLTDDDELPDAHPGHRLRVRLADRSLRQTNPLLGLVASLLELAGGRVTASQVLDLAALAPVRRRFGFSDDDLGLLQTWVAESGIRWGLDAEHRKPYRLHTVAQNTWQAGLDRILLGSAMAEDELRWLSTALPLDDVDSNDIDLAGRLAELIARLTTILDRLDTHAPLTHWLDTITDALDLLGETLENDAWQRAQADRELAELRHDAGSHGQSTVLSLGDLRALLQDRLAGRPTRANFRTGNLTMCSMVPMRSVPHRVICLLGLDDGAFPRGAGVDGDDVLARDPCVGERDPRSEDRQLLLDAVMAAREHLVVLYTGADPRTNAERPPAVPVGEILDVVGREGVLVKHPLQPFDARNFVSGLLGTDRPFSFDRTALAGATRAGQPRVADGDFLATPLPDLPDSRDVGLEDLVSWLEHPCRGFLRQRLDVATLREEEPVADALTVALDPLQKWEVGDRLLQARLAGNDPDQVRQAEWRRGSVPPGALGNRTLDELMQEVEPLVAATLPLLTGDGRAVDAVADLGSDPADGRVTGTISNVHGTTVVRALFSRLGPKHRLRAWLQLLTLTVAHPDTAWTAVTVGRGAKNTDGAVSTLGPVHPDTARASLADLVELRCRGLCTPLPVAAKTSAAYADARRRGLSEDNALAKAEQEWSGGEFGECTDEAHRLVWGDAAPIDRLTAAPADDSDGRDGRGEDESTLFGQLARRVWEPLLDAETRVAL